MSTTGRRSSRNTRGRGSSSSSRRSPSPPPSPSRPPKKLKPASLVNSRAFMTQTLISDFARQRYIKPFSDHALRDTRVVDLTFLQSDELAFPYLQLFQDWGLISFLKIPCTIYPNLVRAFFASGKVDSVVIGGVSTKRIRSNVNGRDISLTPRSLAELLGLPHEGDINEGTIEPFHPPSGNANHLNVHDRFLHFIISHVFRPSGGRYSSLRPVDKWWIHHFRTSTPIDFPTIIFADLATAINRPQQYPTLPYAWVISYLFREKLNVPLDNDLPIVIKSSLNKASLRRSKYIAKNAQGIEVIHMWLVHPPGEDDDGEDDDPQGDHEGGEPMDEEGDGSHVTEPIEEGPPLPDLLTIYRAITDLRDEFVEFKRRFPPPSD